jgi:hypothetical protein
MSNLGTRTIVESVLKLVAGSVDLRLIVESFLVCDEHEFKDEYLFFRFRQDDGTYPQEPDALAFARGQRIYSRQVALHCPLPSTVSLILVCF